MKKNVTRLIALALIALMCLALLPMAAFAAEPEPDTPEPDPPQVTLVRHIIDGQPGEISGLTTGMEYANLDTNWGWVAATSETLLVSQSCVTYFRYVGQEESSNIAVYDCVTVTPSAGEGGSVSPSAAKAVLVNNSTDEGSATFSFTPDEGYELEDVKVNGESVGPQISYTVSNVSAATTVAASFKQTTPTVTSYTVTFDTKGGSPQPPQQTVTAGEPVTLPTGLSRENFDFTGWSLTDGGSPVSSFTPTQSCTLYALWSPVTVYTLSFDANGGSGEMASLTKTEQQGNSFTVPACSFDPPEGGGSFICWNTSADGNGTNYQPENTVQIQNAEIPSLRLYAIWSQGGGSGSGSTDNITVTVTHNRFGRVVYGDSSAPSGTVVSGTPVTVPKGTSFWLQPNEGASTKLVRKDNVQVTAAASYSFQDNGTLEITFELRCPPSEFGTSIGGPSAPVTVGNAQKYTYNISLTLADGSAVPENVVPTGPVSFVIPYPSGLSATSHTYTLKHVPDNQTVSVKAAADGIHGSSASFSAFELLASPRTVSDLSVTVSPTSARPGTVLSAAVTPSTASVTYQWKLNNVAIANETNSTYTVRESDVGNVISCTVTDTTNSANMKPSNGVTPTTAGSSTSPAAAPTTPAVDKHIINGQPGIIKGLATTMEFLAPRSIAWSPCTGATLTVADGWEGTYYFRYKAVGTTPASNAVAVTIRSYYTVDAWVNRGYGTISPDTSNYPAEISKGSTVAVSYVEKGGSYKLSIYPARRYSIYSVLDDGENKGRGCVYTIKSVTRPHRIAVNFAENYSPRTADDSNIPLWTTLCCASLAGIGAVWMILRRRREE